MFKTRVSRFFGSHQLWVGSGDLGGRSVGRETGTGGETELFPVVSRFPRNKFNPTKLSPVGWSWAGVPIKQQQGSDAPGRRGDGRARCCRRSLQPPCRADFIFLALRNVVQRCAPGREPLDRSDSKDAEAHHHPEKT